MNLIKNKNRQNKHSYGVFIFLGGMINVVREFSLINENDEVFSFMDIVNYCLLTDPEGLGYSYANTYEQIRKYIY